MMRIDIDQDLCVGCGVCEDRCPELFALCDDDTIAVAAIPEHPPASLTEKCWNAVALCPMDAITIEEAE